jgi:class 3 adenylate cyclase
MEKGTKQKELYDFEQTKATEKMYQILRFMVPAHVIPEMLKQPDATIAKHASSASILFVIIDDFNSYAQVYSPKDLLGFLNRVFTRYDEVCAANDVTKIETVGEEFVAAVGVIPGDQEIQERDGQAGQQTILGRIIKAAIDILAASSNEGVKVKMGLHTGPVIAGVIGKKLPRFRLFGDTINTSARMMQKGLVGEVQFGDATKRYLPHWVRVTSRGLVEMKGKGQVNVFLLDHAATKETLKTMEDDPYARMLLEPSMPQNWHGATGAAHSPLLAPGQEIEMAGMNSTFSSSKSTHSYSKPSKMTIMPSSLRQTSRSPMNQHAVDKQAADRHAFETVMAELKARDNESTDIRWQIKRMGAIPKNFPPGLEDEWKVWFHEHTICKKLTDRLVRQAAALVILTILELIMHGKWQEDDPSKAHLIRPRYGDTPRKHVYLMCRATCLLIILGWRFAHQYGYLLPYPKEVQMGIFFSYGVIACLMAISYDTLIPDIIEINKLAMLWKENNKTLPKDMSSPDYKGTGFREIFKEILQVKEPPQVIPWPAFFFLIFTVATTQHQLPFIYMCGFCGLALLIMIFEDNVDELNVDVSFNYGKGDRMMFIALAVYHAGHYYSAEVQSRQRCMARDALRLTTSRIDKILSSLMPEIVVEEIRRAPPGSPPPSHQYAQATICQSDLVGFTKLASTRTPKEVVELVGELFGIFDGLCDTYSVYKVETIGDAYIAGQGYVERTDANTGLVERKSTLTATYDPTSVIMMAVMMVTECQRWAARMRCDVDCRVGIHTGSCIGGMVGKEMQRYHLFGHFMSCLEGLESTAPRGKVQVSNACKELIDEYVARSDRPQLTRISNLQD